MLLSISACLLVGGYADKVYFSVTDNEVPGTGSDLIEVDVASKSISVVTNWPGASPFGAVVCGSTYYAWWADITSFSYGMIGVDIGTKSVTRFDTDVLYHALACDPKNSSQLHAVGSVPGSDGAVFTYRRYDLEQQVDNQMVQLPQLGFLGYDAVFSFSADSSQLYVGGGTDKGAAFAHGQQCILDTASLKLTYGPQPYTTSVEPYTVFPDSDPLTGWVTMHGSDQTDHVFAHINLEDSKVTVKAGPSMEKYFNDNPLAVCEGLAYTTSNDHESVWYVYGLDIQTGSEAVSIETQLYQPNHIIGGVACVRS
jgi:hypothetical protein